MTAVEPQLLPGWDGMTWLVPALLGYLLGSIPSAVIVARRAGFDPRVTGDHNAGFWNVKDQLGWRAAWPVFAGDFLKGTLAGLAGLVLGASVWTEYVSVGAAMVGHAWPVFARWRGGKSVLTFAGGVAVLTPVPFALAVAILAVVAGASRSFALGARVAVAALPLLQLAFEPPLRVAATGALMTFIGLKFLLDHLLRRRQPR
ncbi:MAG TPA: glycerol-3-phosphate acyltransferase [Mycobacteriales bacterium]|nr:glycerol-3-phosphate acyltransferase [Mycobacteriales bacterium]